MDERKLKLFEQFAALLSDERKAKIIANAHERTRYATIVLEDVFKEHNISAVLRTADCFGVQDVHLIEGISRYEIDKNVAKGASQWLTIHRYRQYGEDKTAKCFEELRNQGYKIVCTTPHEKGTSIEELPLESKVALIFGTEQQGLSEYALANADAFVTIKQYGFTKSLNISVCAGIILYEVIRRIRASNRDWRLSQEEILELQLQWLVKTTSFGPLLKEQLELL